MTPQMITPQTFAYTYEREREKLNEEAQRQFLMLATPLITELGIDSFGWDQEYRYNDEGYPWEYPGTMDSRWAVDYIYINDLWFENNADDSVAIRQKVVYFLKEFDQELMREIFGQAKVQVFADHIEVTAVENPYNPDKDW